MEETAERQAVPGAAAPRSAIGLPAHAVLAMQRTAGNRATVQALAADSAGRAANRAVLQRQKQDGPYVVTERANLRNDDAEHSVIRALEPRTRVDVIGKGDRKSEFKAGWVSNEHSWSRHQDHQGWIEDSKLAALPAEIEAEEDDDVPAPPQAPVAPPPGAPPPPGPRAPLIRLYQGIENARGEVQHFASELLDAGQRVARPLPATLNATQRTNAKAWIDGYVLAQQSGGGGDHIKRIRESDSRRRRHRRGRRVQHSQPESATGPGGPRDGRCVV